MKIFIAIQNDNNEVLADKDIYLVRRHRHDKSVDYELPPDFFIKEYIKKNTKKSYPHLGY